jgi:Uma2 family endonuclease
MTAASKLPVRMTLAEFMAWTPPGPYMWRLVDGEPHPSAIQNELGALIRNHLAERDSPCTIIVGPGVVPHVQASMNCRIPDLAVTCSAYDTEEAALTDPVLLVEILSPSSQAETWSNVFAYTSIPSVTEILVLSTAVIRAELLRRNADGTWPRQPLTLEGGDLVLESIGLGLPLASAYRTTWLGRRG